VVQSSSSSRDIKPVLTGGSLGRDKQQFTSTVDTKNPPSLLCVKREAIVSPTTTDVTACVTANGQWNGIGTAVPMNRGGVGTSSLRTAGGAKVPLMKATSVTSPLNQSVKTAMARRPAPPVQRTLSDLSLRCVTTTASSSPTKRPATTPDRNSVDQSKRIRLVSAVASSVGDSVFTIRNSHVLSRLGNNGRLSLMNSASSSASSFVARSLKDDINAVAPFVSSLLDGVKNEQLLVNGDILTSSSNGEVVATTSSDDGQPVVGSTLADLMRRLQGGDKLASPSGRIVPHHPSANVGKAASSKNGRISTAAMIATSLGDIDRLNGRVDNSHLVQQSTSLSDDSPIHSPPGSGTSPPVLSVSYLYPRGLICSDG